ncbi:MAG: LacI family DNA-binding transcriptional regulator [Acidobacteriaceae bacterium]
MHRRLLAETKPLWNTRCSEVQKNEGPKNYAMTSNRQPPSKTRTVSLKELAAHLGLSQATVSRVVNRSATSHRISATTQQRVLAAATSMNYKPNVFARGLRNKRSFTVGVIVPEISEGYSTSVLGGIEDTLLQNGFFYFVVSHRHRDDLLLGYPRLLLDRAVEGIIAVDSAIHEDLPIPVVAVSGHGRHKYTVNIELDHGLAARYALDHLHRLGHRRIAFIKGQVFSSDTVVRWNAICKTAAGLGLSIDPKLVVQLVGSAPGIGPGREAAAELLRRKRPFSAIFSFNDLSAIGAITVLHDAGIRVPADISVVGFDDILSASTNNPALTTVRQPLREMGQIAATTLLQLIQRENPDPPKSSIRVVPTLIVRESTTDAPPRVQSMTKNRIPAKPA